MNFNNISNKFYLEIFNKFGPVENFQKYITIIFHFSKVHFYTFFACKIISELKMITF